MTKDMTQGSPLRLILAFAVPLMLGSLFQQFYNLADTIIVGRFVGVEALAAVGSVGGLNYLVLGFVNGIACGFSIPISWTFGAKDYREMRRYTANAVWLSIFFAAVLTVVTVAMTRSILVWTNTPDNIIDLADVYIRTIFVGIPFTLLYNMTSALMRALGDSKRPLYFLLVASFLNIGLDLLCIIVFRMGAFGAAFATVFSQAVAGLGSLLYILKHYGELRWSREEGQLSRTHCAKLCSMGIPMGLQCSITAIGSVVLQGAVNGLGSDIVAAQTAGGKAAQFLCVPLESIGTAMTTYASQNMGAHDLNRVNRGVNTALGIGVVYSIVSFLILRVADKPLIGLFLESDQTEIMANAQSFIFWNSVFYIPLAVLIIYRYTIQGLGYSSLAMFAGVAEMVARFRVFGPSAMNAISSNPYLLCGEPLQLDFRHADSIAQYYHMEGDCTQRLEAALLRTLRHNAGNGHTCLPRAQLLETASNFIHQPPEKLAKALDQCIETDELSVRMFEGTPYIYLPDLLAAEQDIADRLALLAKREKQTVCDLDKNIQVLELTQGFAYAPLQKEAIRKAMTENCLVLTGGPGTGKTTTVNAILQLLEHQAERVALCAPTGRAAKRLSELTGRKASTIHRLLEVDYTGGVVSFIHNDKNLLKCDVVILDEMSMVDVKLFQALIAALRYSCRILMVGDADQLPSVGPGNILGEVIRSERVPTVCLNEIFRQAKRSLIVENAHHIISSEPLQKGGKTDDFFFLESDGDAAQKLVCDLVTTRLPRSYGFDPVRDIQVLCPTKLGPTGTQALNVELQNLLNPEQKGKPQLQSAARVFRVGDKVMQVRNNYEIVWQRVGGEQGVGAYNGDIGIVESINMRERSMVVRMDDRRLLYPAENLNELEIAYAITVHKSQGSEFPAVILPVAQVPPRLCYRNLFYTGVTRARKLCIVTGRRDVVNRMMGNVRQNLRYSGLCTLLQQALPAEQQKLEE